MTVYPGAITSDGAVVRVLVGITPRQRRTLHMIHRPVPQPVALDALVDTGANVTCYDSRAVQAL
jgi:hypothetical protein